jgi:hypothetical protein
MARSDHGRRRRALLIAAMPVHGLWPTVALAMDSGDRNMVFDTARELGLMQPAVLQLAQRIRSTFDLAGIALPLHEAAQRMHTVIGAALSTAKSTMPSLIEDDFAAGLTTQVHGVVFSHTELLLLMAVLGMREPTPS